MINTGEYNTLKVSKETSEGYYLVCEDGQEVLLPIENSDASHSVGDTLKAFIYNDKEGKPVATQEQVKITLNDFSSLKVSAVNQVGAFMDWGLEKELLVPFKEQDVELQMGKIYVVYLGLDSETNRLYGSTKVEKHLQNQFLKIKEGDKVDIIVYKKTELGYSVIINEEHQGLVYDNEVFRPLEIGDKLKAYVKKIRSDNRIDISLQSAGYENVIDKNSQLVYEELKDVGGYIPLTDKSSPEDIYSIFHMSKKAFKKALGDLYKKRKVTISKNGIDLV